MDERRPLAEGTKRWSPYNYGLNNPIRFVDPDGMSAIASAITNVYKIIIQDGQVQSTTLTGTNGGDVTDYITVVNLDAAPYASGTTNYTVDVQTSYTSGVPNDMDLDQPVKNDILLQVIDSIIVVRLLIYKLTFG